MCLSAVIWLSIVDQLANIFCPSGYILTLGDTSCVRGLISSLESPVMTLKKWHGQISWSFLYCNNSVEQNQRKWIVHLLVWGQRGHVFPELRLSACIYWTFVVIQHIEVWNFKDCHKMKCFPNILQNTISTLGKMIVDLSTHKNEQTLVLHSQTIMIKFIFSSFSGQELSKSVCFDVLFKGGFI